MDPFFENFLVYQQFGPSFARREVPAEKVDAFRGRLPDQLLAYWQEHGWCGYAGGLLWTVDPDEWHDALEGWIGATRLAQVDSFHVIARSAFGELVVWGTQTGQSLKIVPAYGWVFPAFDAESFVRRGADKELKLFFSSASRSAYDMKDADGQPLFERAVEKLGVLDHDTLYGFVPALALGGEPCLERLQKLDAHVHLDILAQVTERQVMADVAQAARQ